MKTDIDHGWAWVVALGEDTREIFHFYRRKVRQVFYKCNIIYITVVLMSENLVHLCHTKPWNMDAVTLFDMILKKG